MTADSAAIGSDGLAFLRMILPDQGFYVGYATTVVNGKETRRQWAFHKIEALYTWLGSLNQQGWSVYHANAAFRQEKIWDAAKQRWQRRTHANVRALKILFADIDTRESKPDAPYVDRVEAYEAVIAFCQAAGLPMPLIVSSSFSAMARRRTKTGGNACPN